MITQDASPARWRQHFLRLSIPVMLSNCMVPIVGIVDTAVMGRMGHPSWMAATAVGALLFSSVYWMFGFLRMGTGGLVAQAHGRDEPVEAGRVTARAMLIAAVLGLLLIALQIPILELGLSAMSDAEDWQALTRLYFSIRILSAPATLMLQVIMGTLIGLQLMRQVFFLQLLLNLLNVALTLGLFWFTDLAIRGVAWATVISEYTTLLVGLYICRLVLRRAAADKPVARWLFAPAECLRYVQISGNLFIRTLCLILALYWMTVLSSRMGVAILAANTALLHLVNFAAYFLDGYAHAIETLTGFSVGRRSQSMFHRAVRASLELAFITAMLLSGLYWLVGNELMALMTSDTAVQDLASRWLPWVILVPVVSVWSFLLDGIFIGATQTADMRNSMIISLLVFAAASTILVPAWGNHGIWMSYHVMFITRALTLMCYWPRLNRRLSPAPPCKG